MADCTDVIHRMLIATRNHGLSHDMKSWMGETDVWQ